MSWSSGSAFTLSDIMALPPKNAGTSSQNALYTFQNVLTTIQTARHHELVELLGAHSQRRLQDDPLERDLLPRPLHITPLPTVLAEVALIKSVNKCTSS